LPSRSSRSRTLCRGSTCTSTIWSRRHKDLSKSKTRGGEGEKGVNNKKRALNNKGRLTWALLIILGKVLAFFTAGFSIYKF
jgi:hypothetical protein